MSTDMLPTEVDFLIIGSGGGALCAALRGAASGLSVLVVEKTSLFGGSTALSGGAVWLPDNPVLRRNGVRCDIDEILAYFDAAVGDVGPASSAARRTAFVRGGYEAVEFLEKEGLSFVYGKGWPDYHPSFPGAKVQGRAIEARAFDLRRLGKRKDVIRNADVSLPPVYVHEVPIASTHRYSWRGRLAGIKVLLRSIGKAWGARPVTLGLALYSRLFEAASRRNVPMVLGTSLSRLVVENGRVSGAVLSRDGQEHSVSVRGGVLLAAGGFARNAAMRARYGRQPASADWTGASAGDTGEVMAEALRHGAAVGQMDQAWWIPAWLPHGGGASIFVSGGLSKPRCLVVDASAQRYMNEAASYLSVGNAMYDRQETVAAVPSWAIFDAEYVKRYGWARLGEREFAAQVAAGGIIERGSLRELAEACGLNADALSATIARFNGFASSGKDADFKRGDEAYDRYFGDPSCKPNPNLGPIVCGPFYAAQVYPGDVGTCGGLLTDDRARVLRSDGSVIEGLFAAGNISASVMGRSYLGGGSSLGPAFAFSFIAADEVAQAMSKSHSIGARHNG